MADLLEACKREVANSNQWKLFSQQLFVHIQRHLSAGNVMFFTDLTEQQRLHLTTQASEEIKQSNNSVYQDMVATVSSTMDRNVNQYASLRKGNRSRNDFTMELLAGLSSQLLMKWPNHKRLLGQCFNRRLPVTLRITVWQVMLQNKQIYQSYVTKATSTSSHDPASTGYHVYQQCQHLIGSNKMFSLLAENGLCLQVMKDVVVFWKLQCGKQQLSQVDIVLSIPFVFLRLRELTMIKQGAKMNIVQLAGMIAEQYVSFMTQRPPTMMDGGISVTQSAMVTMLRQVLTLIARVDDTFYQSLRAALLTGGSPSTEEEAIAASLLPLLHPFVQRLFVGDVSMDVVCFIWDQCFIGLGIGGYQYIPYLIAVLLLIMKEPLLQCKEASAISFVIKSNLAAVEVIQIQLMVEKYFYRELANQLQAPLVAASRTSYVDPLLEPLPQWSHYTSEHPSVPNWNELQKQKRTIDEAKKRELQEAREAAAEARRQRDNQVTELQAEVTRLREQLATLNTIPRPADKNPPDEDTTETPQLPATDNNDATSKLSSPMQSSPTHQSTSALPTLQGSPQASPDHSSPTSSTHSAAASESVDPARKQAQETWLTILDQFSNAVDLVCHGPNEN